MINNETMYGFYKEALKYKHDTIINSTVITELEKTLLTEIIEDIKKVHPKYIHIGSIVELTNDEIKALKIKPSHKLFITNYITTYNNIEANKVKAKEVSKIRLTQSQFSFILTTFNRLLWEAIIYEAYVFKYAIIGRIHAVCRKNESCKPKMNWKASLANKNAIIARGGIPRVELDARRAEFYNEQYDGEKWVETNEPFNVTIVWKRSAYSVAQIPTSKDFSMKLVKSPHNGNGVIDALKEMRDNNRLDDLIIKYRLNHG